jgi:uncharacterized protein YwqG
VDSSGKTPLRLAGSKEMKMLFKDSDDFQEVMNKDAWLDSQLKKIEKQALSFKVERLDNDIQNTSKYGGKPCLESMEEWPKKVNGQYMNFIGQLNFEELSLQIETNLASAFPQKGILLFFLDDEKMYEYNNYAHAIYKEK